MERIVRTQYMSQVRPYYESDVIKVLTGVRRSGKSVLLEDIRREIAESGVSQDHIIYLNFEDEDSRLLFPDDATLNDGIKARIVDKGRYYIFLDEIQYVRGFERALASFRATLNASIFVTGSNSTLLSGEMASMLSGRTVEFEVLPFAFSEAVEYLTLNHRDYDMNAMFRDYLRWGGFPVRFDWEDEQAKRRYLNNLYVGIVGRDIVRSKKGTDREAFLAIAQYVFNVAGGEISPENIAAYYNANNNRTVSTATVTNYLYKMERAFLVHRSQRYDISGKKVLKSRAKYYVVDTGLRTISCNADGYSETRYLENIVYNELLYQGYTVYTGKTYRGEVDFVATGAGGKCFIQVCYLLADESTIKREFSAFAPIKDASPKCVMSLDVLDMSRDGIRHVNIIDFLLHRVTLAA